MRVRTHPLFRTNHFFEGERSEPRKARKPKKTCVPMSKRRPLFLEWISTHEQPFIKE